MCDSHDAETAQAMRTAMADHGVGEFTPTQALASYDEATQSKLLEAMAIHQQEAVAAGRPAWEFSVKVVLTEAVKEAMLSGTADPLETIGQYVLREAAAARAMPKLELRYYFRGVWWPGCRKQLAQLIQEAPGLLADGVRVHLITAQPGGADFLKTALLERDLPNPPGVPPSVQLSSDPEHKLLARDAGDIYTSKTQDKMMGVSYQMLQPALVVIDTATGKVIPALTWSWKTMGIQGDNLTELYEVQPGVQLVTYRPLIADLRAAIRERRPVKLNHLIKFEELKQQVKPEDRKPAA